MLSKNEKLVISITSLWALANTMSAVFVNVYLYAYTGSLVVMTIFSIIRIAQFPVFFTLAGKWAQRKKFSPPLVMGLLITMLSLICVLTMNDMFELQPSLVYIVAILIGAGEGFFWLSINSLHQIVSTEQSRPRYLGTQGIFNNIANIFAPMLATLIIDHSESDVSGYITIFKLVLVVYVVMSFLAFQVKGESSKEPFSVFKCLSLKENADWRYCCIMTFLYGMRDAVILTLAGLLVYNATEGSGSLYSRLLTLFAVVAIASFYYTSRKLKPQNMYKLYTIGAVLISSSTILLVLWPSVYGAIYYGVVNALAGAMYGNPYSIIVMGEVNKFSSKENIVGRVIAKEIYLSIGRCTGMLFIVICSFVFSESLYLPISVVFCSLFPIWVVLYTQMHRKRKAKEA